MPSTPLTTRRPVLPGKDRPQEGGPGLQERSRRRRHRRLPTLPLAAPSVAREVQRPPMGRVGTWMRRLERRINLEMGRWVYPYTPGMSGVYSYQLRRNLVVATGDIAVPRLAPAFDGTTVLLVTDIHTGPFLRVGALAESFQRLQELEPDLILLGGDLTTGTVEEFQPFMPAFAALEAPLGVHAVMGNHDYYSGDPDRLVGLIGETGVNLLHNRSVTLERQGESLVLAGIDDLHWGQPDLDAALGDGEPPELLLSHNPDVFFAAARRGVGLVLAGHTHGGQIRLPGLPLVIKMSRYALDEGRYNLDASQLVVSRGLGVTGVPVRWDCAPEAVLVTLRRPAEPAC
jgi:predicted MPP superfamily phosphohydrolase